MIDNASSDGTVDLIRSYKDTVICIANAKNVGFSAANLQGYKQASGRYVLFLNPDMEVDEGSLDKMVEWMDVHPGTGIAGCRLVTAEGDFNHEAAPRRFPRLHEHFILLLKFQKLFPGALDRYLYKDLDFSREQSVDTVRGSFMLMRREFIDSLGWPFDPRYYIWFEDVDICREAWKKGFTVDYTPVVSCRDAIGQSFRQRDRRWRFRQYTESLGRYLRKWEPFHVWCWVPLLYRPLAFLIGSTWVKYLKFGSRT